MWKNNEHLLSSTSFPGGFPMGLSTCSFTQTFDLRGTNLLWCFSRIFSRPPRSASRHASMALGAMLNSSWSLRPKKELRTRSLLRRMWHEPSQTSKAPRAPIFWHYWWTDQDGAKATLIKDFQSYCLISATRATAQFKLSPNLDPQNQAQNPKKMQVSMNLKAKKRDVPTLSMSIRSHPCFPTFILRTIPSRWGYLAHHFGDCGSHLGLVPGVLQ